MSLIEPYSASHLSLIFFGAPHEMDETLNCKICRPITSYKGKGLILLCPEMKRFCSNPTICKFMIDYHNGKRPTFIHLIPADCKSWSFIISSNNDDVPDIVPVFHTVAKYDELLEQIEVGLKQSYYDKKQLEHELQETNKKIDTLKNAQNHILYGVPIKNFK